MSVCSPASLVDRIATEPQRPIRRRIVLVDDEPGLLHTWGIILSASGYDVQCFSDARSALETIAGGCDCVITDYHMPHMTGVELIRAASPRSRAKFILMTANSADSVTQEALSAGAICVVYKPISPPVVLQKIASLWR